MSLRIGTLGALILALALGGSAQAQSPTRARTLTREALALYRAARYDDAILRFAEAYALSSAPLLLYDIAQAYRLSGDCGQARRYYADYLRQAPAARNRGGVEAKIAAMDACTAARPAPPAAASPVLVSRAVVPPVQTSTASEPPAAAPEPDAHPAVAVPLTTPAAEHAVVAVPTSGPPALVDEPRPHAHRRPRLITGLALAGTGLALVAGAVYLSVKAADSSQQVSRFFASGGRWSDQLEAIETSGRNATTASAPLYAVGGALGVAGITVCLVYWKRER